MKPRSALTAEHMEQNAILRGLGDSARAEIMKHGALVTLVLREQIYEPEPCFRS